jgi:hypothetical protein
VSAFLNFGRADNSPQIFAQAYVFKIKCGSDFFLSRNLASRHGALKEFIQQDGFKLSINNGGVLWQAAR